MEGLKRKRMEKLIGECQRIESGKGELYILLSKLRPDSEWLRYTTGSIPRGKVRKLRDQGEALAELADHERNHKLADLAELLEEEGFDLEIFRSHLREDHYYWLYSRHKEIKKSLRGIQL
jgi:hypothetical protein